MKTEAKLARVFSALAGDEKRTESTASAVLAIVKDAGITKTEDFNTAVEAAYEANGWNKRPGRPAADNTADAVPDTVRTYVSWVRAALDAGMRVSRFSTFQELRNALAKRRLRVVPGSRANGNTTKTAAAQDTGNGNGGAGGIKIPADVVESFHGVQIAEGKPNGGLFHDLALVYIKLDVGERGLFGRQLNRLLGQYRPHAFPARGKKAA